MEQGSSEWHAARLGRVTASRVADVLAKTKSGYSTSRINYMSELICERLTGERAEGFTSAAMLHGIEKEPEARELYAFAHDCDVNQVGFVPHPEIVMAGASPDGLIGDAGLVEIKCPNTATHIETLRSRAIPGKYATQMLWQMACTGRAWCDFASYDPRLPAELRLFVARLHRDDKAIAEMEREVSAFLGELDAALDDLRAYGRREAA